MSGNVATATAAVPTATAPIATAAAAIAIATAAALTVSFLQPTTAVLSDLQSLAAPTLQLDQNDARGKTRLLNANLLSSEPRPHVEPHVVAPFAFVPVPAGGGAVGAAAQQGVAEGTFGLDCLGLLAAAEALSTLGVRGIAVLCSLALHRSTACLPLVHILTQ